MKLNRRSFIGTAAAASVLSAPMVQAAGHGKPRVVVVGGGAGGATAARYIAKDSKGEIDVTLIEPTRTYYTCFFSNLYLGGFKEISDIGHTYGTLASEYGINVVHDWAVGVDRDAKTVALAGGASVALRQADPLARYRLCRWRGAWMGPVGAECHAARL